MTSQLSRRELALAAACAPLLAGCRSMAQDSDSSPLFRISLAQWSLHRTIRAGELTALDFPQHARDVYGIEAVEYVNQFFADRAEDPAWINALRQRAEDAGVRSVLIMVDGEGSLAASDSAERARAIRNHVKWLGAAANLGCHAMRVNAAGDGDPAEMQRRAADSLVQLADHAVGYQLNVIVENHGGLSSNGAWLSGVMRIADHPRVGTLPDFGNFRIQGDEWYDRYLGSQEMMPFAKAVSAKSHDFDADGNEVHTDYRRMMRIVLDAGYRGFVGVEYEGDSLSEHDGIVATQRLLERVREELAPEFA
ncbi:MAG: TIM barrel protein [Planctomycetes bacterium]|nr:TIM barrel protein [Planctomycetota bacterium]MCB9906010.1 TIM barrel protein [Planctomycetota bacterium]